MPISPNVSRWKTIGELPHEGRLGVIDIGSNSIRLVIYDGIKRVPLPIFNEKAFCELGKGLAISGRLNPEGVKLAEKSIKRFLSLVRIMDVVELQILATAAVRDALDGAEFVERLERKYHINISVISGKKEAALAAAGIFSSVYRPEGLVADLGGGSIELIHIDAATIKAQATLPIGPLRLLDSSHKNKTEMRSMIREAFEQERWIEKLHPKHFYAIGGSFRSIAHIHMAHEQYPLDIIQHYTVSAAALRPTLKTIYTASVAEIAKMKSASSKRAEALIPAAIILETILDTTSPIDVIFSASGIREGYLYEKLSPSLRAEDPLIASCADLATQNGHVTTYAKELFAWMNPLFPHASESENRLRFAACILREIAWRIHPEYRGEWAHNRIMQSTLTGLSHRERAMIALAIYHRYHTKIKSPLLGVNLLSSQQKTWARLFGVAANLAFQVSGGMAGNLEKIRLEFKKGKLGVDFEGDAQDIVSDAIRKRIDGVADAFLAHKHR